MHGLAFQSKRVHLQCVRFGKQRLERVEHMTPARFDLLYLIRTRFVDREGFYAGCCIAFQDLEEMLGLSHSTISVMLNRLEDFRWVRRTAVSWDRRRTLVTLTEIGAEIIDQAMDIVFGERKHVSKFNDHFACQGVPRDRVVHYVLELILVLRRFAMMLGDSIHTQCPGLPIAPLDDGTADGTDRPAPGAGGRPPPPLLGRSVGGLATPLPTS